MRPVSTYSVWSDENFTAVLLTGSLSEPPAATH